MLENTKFIRQLILETKSQHPAIARLKSSLLEENLQRQITSYDRMHHRHSRSDWHPPTEPPQPKPEEKENEPD